MTYTLSEAAEVTGRSRGAILRALQTGEITATHNEAADEWTIEPDDLFRVFPVAYHIRFVLEARQSGAKRWSVIPGKHPGRSRVASRR